MPSASFHRLNTAPAAHVAELAAATPLAYQRAVGPKAIPVTPSFFDGLPNRLDGGVDPRWGSLWHRFVQSIRREPLPDWKRRSRAARSAAFGLLIEAAAAAAVFAAIVLLRRCV